MTNPRNYSLRPAIAKTLKEAAEDTRVSRFDLINAPDGKNYWGEISPEMAAQAKGKIEPGQIVIQKGAHFAAHKGFGAAHIITQHEADFKRYGYEPDQYVHNILRNPDAIWQQGERYLLVKNGYPKGFSAIELRKIQGEDTYSVVSAFPEDPRLAKKINGVMVWKRGAKSTAAVSDQPRPLSRSVDNSESHPPLEEAGTIKHNAVNK